MTRKEEQEQQELEAKYGTLTDEEQREEVERLREYERHSSRCGSIRGSWA